jgi:hypothetical protein
VLGVPFLPLVLLLAWQALSRAAAFALGWATALYFGQVPGSKGRTLAVVSLVSAGWLIVTVGFGLPLLIGAGLDAAGIVERNFEVEPLHALVLGLAIVLVPPANAASTVIVEFFEERSWRRWVEKIPASYPATASLGLAVLLMVVITPVLLVERLRHKRSLLQVPVIMREGTDDDDLTDTVRSALRQLEITDLRQERVEGIRALPLRAAAVAAHNLLGATVRGEPMRLVAGDLEVYAYATNVAILGPRGLVHRARAAIERELAFADAYLTWSEDSQRFEDELRRIRHDTDGDVNALATRLDELQGRIDEAPLNGDEWNVLYRLRLQTEQAARTKGEKAAAKA